MTDYLDKVVSALDVGSVPNWITTHVKDYERTGGRGYFNLLATPAITVQVKADKFTARAILAEGETRDRLWKLMTEVHPAYLDYQAKTSRELPVFSLEKVSE